MRLSTIVLLAASASLAAGPAVSQLLPSPEGEGFEFETELSGAQEVPPVQTSGSGSFQIHFDEPLSEAEYRLDFSGTSSMATAAHLHCAVAGENGPVVVTLLLSGAPSLDRMITNAEIDPAAGAAEVCGIPINNVASLLAAIRQDRIYVNVHTEGNPAGELRGQLFPDATRTQSQAGPSVL